MHQPRRRGRYLARRGPSESAPRPALRHTVVGADVVLVGYFSAKQKDFETLMASAATRLAARGARLVVQIVQRRGVSDGGVQKITSSSGTARTAGCGSMPVMRSWKSLNLAGQALMRRALWEWSLAGVIQDYGAALRWAGAGTAPPPRSYTEDEQRALVPQFAAVAVDLAERGLLSVLRGKGLRDPAASVVAETELRQTLADSAYWLWAPGAQQVLSLTVPPSVDDDWFDGRFPPVDTSALATWDELSPEQREVLVCAEEGSGWFTGPFGVWEDPPPELDANQRLAWVKKQIAPLVPFVRDGWIEVRHHPVEDSDAFTVIGLNELPTALADPTIRYDGDAWGVGVSCTFTDTGEAVWNAAWAKTWAQRLRLD